MFTFYIASVIVCFVVLLAALFFLCAASQQPKIFDGDLLVTAIIALVMSLIPVANIIFAVCGVYFLALIAREICINSRDVKGK